MTPEEFKLFMQRHNLTDAQLAKILGVTVPAIHHWWTGRRKIHNTMVKLFKTFDRYPGLMAEF